MNYALYLDVSLAILPISVLIAYNRCLKLQEDHVNFVHHHVWSVQVRVRVVKVVLLDITYHRVVVFLVQV